MIYSLKGNLVLIGDNFLVVECGGVGYKCMCSTSTENFLKEKINSEVTVYTYLSVRQDSVELFGFYDAMELENFKLLISVSGIGPKAALAILSCFSPTQLASVISSSDSKSLTLAQGIGIKTAKRVVLELKDKFSKISRDIDIENGKNDIMQSTLANKKKKTEALNALMFLGYSKSEVMPCLSNLSENLSVEEMISSTLKYMGKGG